jgi:hypothetical protein
VISNGGPPDAAELVNELTGDPELFKLASAPGDVFLFQIRVHHSADRGAVVVGSEQVTFATPGAIVFCLEQPCTCLDGSRLPFATTFSDAPLGPFSLAYTRWPSSLLPAPAASQRFPEVLSRTRDWVEENVCAGDPKQCVLDDVADVDSPCSPEPLADQAECERYSRQFAKLLTLPIAVVKFQPHLGELDGEVQEGRRCRYITVVDEIGG